MIDYIYKKKNKFPYIVYFDWNVPLWSVNDFYTKVNPWCRENIGEYRKVWFCPSAIGLLSPEGYPYAFKTKEDAMAFKLRWT